MKSFLGPSREVLKCFGLGFLSVLSLSFVHGALFHFFIQNLGCQLCTAHARESLKYMLLIHQSKKKITSISQNSEFELMPISHEQSVPLTIKQLLCVP